MVGWGGDDGEWVYSCGYEGCLVFFILTSDVEKNRVWWSRMPDPGLILV